MSGIGHSLLPAVLTVIGSCVLRIIWIYSLFLFYPYYWMLMIVYPVSWALTGIAVMTSYIVISRKAYKNNSEQAGSLANVVIDCKEGDAVATEERQNAK